MASGDAERGGDAAAGSLRRSGPAEAQVAFVSLPLERIVLNPRQPRRRFAGERLDALARSIEHQGVIQPLVVRVHPARNGHYELVAGERRYKAIQQLGWQTAPALIRVIADEALLETALVENVQREPLTAIEEALAYRALLDHHGYTQEALAERVGRDRSTIANLVRLLALPQVVQEDLEESRLTIGHARALLAVSDPVRQIALRNLIVQKNWSVRETERRANHERAEEQRTIREEPSAPFGGSPEAAPEALAGLHFNAAQEALESHLATRVGVRLQEKGERGVVEIEFYSTEDFNRLYDLLLGR